MSALCKGVVEYFPFCSESEKMPFLSGNFRRTGNACICVDSDAIYINSFGGQRVIDESTSIANHIYFNTSWEKIDKSIQKDLAFIIMRANKPLVAKASSFGCMQLPLFLKVMRGVYMFIMSKLKK